MRPVPAAARCSKPKPRKLSPGRASRAVGLKQGRRPAENGTADAPIPAPTLADLGFEGDRGKKQSAAYQELAHPDVAENVILDAIATSARPRRSGWPGGAGIAGAPRPGRIKVTMSP
jgi:hypothetical protein